jgi:mannose-1-phosphate guanylyltransferase
VPKQLLAIASEQSLLADTLTRIRPLAQPGNVHVVTVAAHADAIRREAHGVARRNVHVEPRSRNTAAAIALAALRVHASAPDAVMLVLPADHAVPDGPAFRRTMTHALSVATRSEALVTIGVKPDRPETGFGYIEAGAPWPGSRGRARRVRRFREKPDRATARRLVARADVLWNAGIFAWRASGIIGALRRYVPEVIGPLETALRRGTPQALARAYAHLPAISIDTGVLERADAVAVVPAGFRWSDVGSWDAVGHLWRRPGTANATRGDVVTLDSEGCVVDAADRLVALVGVRDLIVVQTPDAVLVCPRARAQDVRHVVDELRRRGRMRLV